MHLRSFPNIRKCYCVCFVRKSQKKEGNMVGKKDDGRGKKKEKEINTER